MSYMGRIALDIREHTEDEAENNKICEELSSFWKDGDISKLSPKAKEIWHAWKEENKKYGKSNVEEISDI